MTVIEMAKVPEAETVPVAKSGVLLANLGTPDTADARGVRVYLREFLSDPRVIENQGLIWRAILNGIVLQIRPKRKARDYLKVWNTEKNESPLKTITRSQAEKLGASLQGDVPVEWGMRYGNPSLRSALDALIAKGCERILVVPLYPQYSAATTATVFDKIALALRDMRAQPTLRFAPPYFDDAAYIDALAVSVRQSLGALVSWHAAKLYRQGRSLCGAMRNHHAPITRKARPR
jgi:ferrochelatase